MSTGYPGYDSIIGKDAATIGTILQDNGYNTSWFGKEHNVPDFLHGPAGPLDDWPNGSATALAIHGTRMRQGL